MGAERVRKPRKSGGPERWGPTFWVWAPPLCSPPSGPTLRPHNFRHPPLQETTPRGPKPAWAKSAWAQPVEPKSEKTGPSRFGPKSVAAGFLMPLSPALVDLPMSSALPAYHSSSAQSPHVLKTLERNGKGRNSRDRQKKARTDNKKCCSKACM